MAEYFGHRTKWRGGTKWTTPQGGPVAARPQYPSNYGVRSGQIIPPNRGQYPRGKSLPGYTPASGSSEMREYARHRGYAANQMMTRKFGGMAGKALGKLLPGVGLALSAYDMYEWWNTTAPGGQLQFPAGWTVSGCDRGLPRQKYWGINDASCTGIRNFNMQNTPVLAGANWVVHCTEATPVVMPITYNRNVKLQIPVATAGNPFNQAYAPRASRTTRSERRPYMDAPPQPEIQVKGYPRPAILVRPKDRYFGPRLPPRGSTEYPNYPHVPPPPNVKEKKGLVFNTGRAGKAYGALTEFRDFADCLSASIPGQPCRKYRKNLHLYAACIAEHHNDVNMPEAIACFFGAQAKDTAIGRPSGIFQRGASKGPYWSRPVGPGAGNWARPGVPRMTPI